MFAPTGAMRQRYKTKDVPSFGPAPTGSFLLHLLSRFGLRFFQMKSSFFLVASALVVGSWGLPSSNHVVHEKRNKAPHGWIKRASTNSEMVLPMRVGLKQRNLHKAQEYLMDVSDPESPNYGNHWSAKQVAETFAPR
jgi:hypothetical protein